MKSVSIGALGSDTLTRRTATVTIWAPDAATAAAFCSKSLYFPVPTIRREVKLRPATLHWSVNNRLLRNARFPARRPRRARRRRGLSEIGRAHVELQSLMRNQYADFCLN